MTFVNNIVRRAVSLRQLSFLYFYVNLCGVVNVDDFRTASSLLFRSLVCGQLQLWFQWLLTSCVQLAYCGPSQYEEYSTPLVKCIHFTVLATVRTIV